MQSNKFSTFLKLFAALVTTQLTSAIRTIVCACKHGFIKRRSAAINLLVLVGDVLQSFEEYKQTAETYTYFLKASNMADRNLLILKLKCLGFFKGCSLILIFLTSFLFYLGFLKVVTLVLFFSFYLYLISLVVFSILEF